MGSLRFTDIQTRPTEVLDLTSLTVDEFQQLSGFVNLLRLISSQGKRVRDPDPPCPLGSPLRTCDLGPTLESVAHLLTVRGRGQQMPSRAEVLGNGTIRRQKALGMTGGFEPLHATLTLTRRPMRILTPVIEVATLAMFNAW
jgi:hypothetical protein